jgi:drug/metabolite transporter (DMT)-like permease
LASSLFLGLLPVFGKQAILLGLSPLAVVALRTILSAGLLFAAIALFQRAYLFIYPAGFLGCLLAGGVNGLGSLFFYTALGRIDAGLGQLLYSLYPLFTVLWFRLDHQRASRLTLIRLVLAIPAVYLLIQTQHNSLDLLGVIMMLVAALLYALHLPINQRVLYDMPAPTVTLYTLLSMSAIVVPAFLVSSPELIVSTGSVIAPVPMRAWWAMAGLTLATFLSRITLFMGVKHIGGVQTALLGLGELLVTIFFAQIWLGERLSHLQWLGGALLAFSLVLILFEKPVAQQQPTDGLLRWLHPQSLTEKLTKSSQD